MCFYKQTQNYVCNTAAYCKSTAVKIDTWVEYVSFFRFVKFYRCASNISNERLKVVYVIYCTIFTVYRNSIDLKINWYYQIARSPQYLAIHDLIKQLTDKVAGNYNMCQALFLINIVMTWLMRSQPHCLEIITK